MNSKDSQINDCWNQIGVWRQQDDICPKLATVIHCRNCETYINAGLVLLDRELPENYTAENTESYKTTKADQDNASLSCIIFRIESEWYALKTALLAEICETCEIHTIPHNKQKILSGVVNIRGEIEICISLKELCTNVSHDKNSTHHARMIIINLDSGKYAYHADEVMGIFKIDESEIKQAPTSISATGTHLIQGMFDFKETSIGLIDPELMNNKLMGILA